MKDADVYLLKNATIWFGRTPTPRRCWIRVRDGIVAEVGHKRDPAVTTDRVVDLDGAHLLPGLVDIHTRLTTAAWGSVFVGGAPWRTYLRFRSASAWLPRRPWPPSVRNRPSS